MKKGIDFLKAHLDFRFYGVSWIALLVLILIFPALIYLPQKYGYENGLLENLQMCVLFCIGYLCLSAKQNKKLFQFATLFLLIIIFREVNLGRTLFFPIPNEIGKYYSWRQISSQLGWPIGKCVHFTYGLFIAIVSIVFFLKKVCIKAWELIKYKKLPVWNLVFMGISSFCGAIAEKATNNNFIFEEGFELLFYVSLMGIVYLYTRNKDFSME